MSRASRQASLERTRQEILEEQVRALTRISDRLQSISEECRLLYQRCQAGDKRAVPMYHQKRRAFERYLWYWVVQREAMGFRFHPRPEDWLFVPPPLHD